MKGKMKNWYFAGVNSFFRNGRKNYQQLFFFSFRRRAPPPSWSPSKISYVFGAICFFETSNIRRHIHSERWAIFIKIHFTYSRRINVKHFDLVISSSIRVLEIPKVIGVWMVHYTRSSELLFVFAVSIASEMAKVNFCKLVASTTQRKLFVGWKVKIFIFFIRFDRLKRKLPKTHYYTRQFLWKKNIFQKFFPLTEH